MIDGRSGDASRYRDAAVISSLCSQYGTDGLIILGNSSSMSCDFGMEFFNPDGTSGMMCGNGGRCVVAFASDLGMIGDRCRFLAPDGEHSASISAETVRLSMRKPSDPVGLLGGWFVDTGARHFVKFVDDLESVDVETLGKELRFAPEFSPEGVNVDFVQRMADGSISVRTFEKGVERETLSCGTGVTAAAIVSLELYSGIPNPVTVHAREADLTVERDGDSVFLTGPARRVL